METIRCCHLNIEYEAYQYDRVRMWSNYFKELEFEQKTNAGNSNVIQIEGMLIAREQMLSILLTGNEVFLGIEKHDADHSIQMIDTARFDDLDHISSQDSERLFNRLINAPAQQLSQSGNTEQARRWGKQIVLIRDSEFKEEQGLKSFMEGKTQWYRNTAPKNSDFFSSKISDQVYSDVKQLKDIYNTAKIQSNMEGNRLYRGVLLKQFRGIDLGESPILKEVHDSLIKGNFVKDIQKDMVR